MPLCRSNNAFFQILHPEDRRYKPHFPKDAGFTHLASLSRLIAQPSKHEGASFSYAPPYRKNTGLVVFPQVVQRGVQVGLCCLIAVSVNRQNSRRAIVGWFALVDHVAAELFTVRLTPGLVWGGGTGCQVRCNCQTVNLVVMATSRKA